MLERIFKHRLKDYGFLMLCALVVLCVRLLLALRLSRVAIAINSKTLIPNHMTSVEHSKRVA